MSTNNTKTTTDLNKYTLVFLLLFLVCCCFVWLKGEVVGRASKHKYLGVVLDNKLSWNEIQTQKGSNERLFILTLTHSMQIFWEIPFIKP